MATLTGMGHSNCSKRDEPQAGTAITKTTFRRAKTGSGTRASRYFAFVVVVAFVIIQVADCGSIAMLLPAMAGRAREAGRVTRFWQVAAPDASPASAPRSNANH